MVKYERLLRNSRAFRLFAGDWARGALHHGYLVSAPDQGALFEFAKLCACLLYCERGQGRPCLSCAGCLRYEALTGANALVYPKGDRIKKDDVEDLLHNIHYKSFEHGTKVAVLRGADRMDASAQNRLLKTLEEPPAGVLFLLLAANPEKLLPTVRSRLKALVLEPFSPREVEDELAPRLGRGAALSVACKASGGYPGSAEALALDPGFADVLRFCEQLLAGLKSRADFVRFSGRFEEIKPRYEQFLDFLQLCLRDAMMAAEGREDGMLGRPINLSAPAERLAECIEYVNLCKQKLRFNCNPSAAYQMLLIKLTTLYR